MYSEAAKYQRNFSPFSLARYFLIFENYQKIPQKADENLFSNEVKRSQKSDKNQKRNGC